MKFIPIFSLIYLIGLSFLTPQLSHAQVVAFVGKKQITLADFKMKYDEVKKKSINPPPPEVFLEDLVRFEMGVQEANKKNLKEDPIVKERFKQELYKALLEKSIGKKVQSIKVTEKDMKKFYKTNPEIRTSHILIELKPDATKTQFNEAKKRANEIYSEVKKSKRSFEELVRLYTDDTLSKTANGDIGYQSRVTLVPPYYDLAVKMKMNSIKGLVRTKFGFHIVKLTGRRTYRQANKRQIRASVFDEKRRGIFNNYFKKLKTQYKISTNKSILKNLKSE